MSPVGSQPELDSLDPTSGPGLIIPNGNDGPGIVFPPPSTPRNGSTWFARRESAAVARAHIHRMALRLQLIPRIVERARAGSIPARSDRARSIMSKQSDFLNSRALGRQQHGCTPIGFIPIQYATRHPSLIHESAFIHLQDLGVPRSRRI